MELRVKRLEDGLKGLSDEMIKLKDALNLALLGSLEGKPGIMATLQSLHEARKQDAVTMAKLSNDMDGLRLDRSKVIGICITVSVCWGLFMFVFNYIRHP